MSHPLDPVRGVMGAPEDIDMGDVPLDASPPAPSNEQEYSDGPPGDDDATPAPEVIAATFPLNDVGNGQRFRLYHGENLIRVPNVGWFLWDGQRWEKDKEDGKANSILVRGLAQGVSERMEREVEHIVLAQWQRDHLAKLPDAQQRVRDLRKQREGGDIGPEGEAQLIEAELAVRKGESVRSYLTKQKAAYRTFAKSTGNSGKIEAMMKEAAIGLTESFDVLDSHDREINTASGILRFTVSPGEAYPDVAYEVADHDRSRFHTKMMPVEFDPDARAPTWMQFLERVQPSQPRRAFLQRWFGLNMTTSTSDQQMVFNYGHGANGKSVMADLMGRMFGDYGTTAKIETLTGQNRRGGDSATPDLIPLMGARMVRASEPEEGERLQEALIKELTGGEPMLVRALHSDFVEVRPQFKLTISGNHKPQIRGTDDGIWRRVLLVPWEVQIPPEERDHALVDKLWAERSGILNWLIEGLVSYLEGGLAPPDEILDATQAYRSDSDPIGAFLEECCHVTGASEDSLPGKELTDAFAFWQMERGETPWKSSARKFSDHADRWVSSGTGMKFTKRKASSIFYDGIRFNDTFKRRFDDAGTDRLGRKVPGSASADSSPDPF